MQGGGGGGGEELNIEELTSNLDTYNDQLHQVFQILPLFILSLFLGFLLLCKN